MVEIRMVDTENKKQVKEFIQLHFDLYKGNPYWVPPFRGDIEIMLNKKKHPFYEHSAADFFTAWKDGKMVGRIAALDNTSYNEYHKTAKGSFFLFDSIDDQEVANALFDAASEWCRKRGLDHIMGPKGFSLYDGYGMLSEGFEERQMINMSAYNYPYYLTLCENYGFSKNNEFVSMRLVIDDFKMPEKAYKVAERVKEKGTLSVKCYSSRKEVQADGMRIAKMYLASFENNWEYAPMTEKEFKFLIDSVISMVDPKLIRFIQNENKDLVGMVVAFPDISAALQRHNGNLTPALLADMLLTMNKTDNIAINGMGILEEYRGRGGSALLYTSLEEVLRSRKGAVMAEAVQMAESAKEIQLEMQTLGLTPIKRHRVYEKAL